MKELGFPNSSIGNLKEQLLRTTLRTVRSQGHPYVELREDGKKLIFFCTLCLAPCYGDSSLFNHLNGNLHTERLATAQITMLKPNPWPFNDGVFFFHDTEEQNKISPVSDSEKEKLLDIHHADADNLALVTYVENLGISASTHTSLVAESSGHCDENLCDSNMDSDGTNQQIVIPAVLQKDEVSDLVVRHMGVGKIGARFVEMDGFSNGIRKIWCEWLGEKTFTNEDSDVVAEHDFSVVTFPYNYNLGRRGFLDGFRYLLPSSPHSEGEDSGCSRGKKRKSFSDPEDISNQDDSSGEESQSSNSSKSKLLYSGNDDQQVYSRILSSKTMRKQLRNQQRIASERTCDICQQKMLPDKDVAALLNRRTGKLACSSRNTTGVEVNAKKQSVESIAKAKPRSKRKIKGKKWDNARKQELQETQIHSTFCPECQGTGISIDGDELEKPTVSLSEMFRYKIKLRDAHKAWMRSPELLQNCSMGFDFHLQSAETYQEMVTPLKLVHFYRADG